MNPAPAEHSDGMASAAVGKSCVCAQALDALDQAVAVIDTTDNTVLWSSQAFTHFIPAARANANWQLALQPHPILAQCYSSLCAPEQQIDTLPFELDGDTADFTVKFLPDAKHVVHIQPSISIANQMRQYMHARDRLFSTSRTISVSEMATTLAHEINQPIGTIVNLLRGVKSRVGNAELSAEQIQQALDRALDQALFTTKIVARIREFTQSRRPRQKILDLRPLIDEAMALLDWLVSTNGCSIHLQLPDEPLFVRGDATMLQQVLVNLFRNAVDAMQDEPLDHRNLQVIAHCAEQRIVISISDTGHGLFGQSDKLFIPFVTNKENGMGVGLNICRSFIELHQGRLWLSPNDEGGCTARVELPAAHKSGEADLMETNNA